MSQKCILVEASRNKIEPVNKALQTSDRDLRVPEVVTAGDMVDDHWSLGNEVFLDYYDELALSFQEKAGGIKPRKSKKRKGKQHSQINEQNASHVKVCVDNLTNTPVCATNGHSIACVASGHPAENVQSNDVSIQISYLNAWHTSMCDGMAEVFSKAAASFEVELKATLHRSLSRN